MVARQLEREKHVTIELVERLGLFKELVGKFSNCLLDDARGNLKKKNYFLPPFYFFHSS